MVRPRRHADSGAGFTLVELLVTLTVTVIGLAGLMSLHVTTTRGNQSVSRMAEATTIGQQTLEELRSMPMAEIEASFATIPFTNEIMSTIDGRAGMVYSRRLDVLDLSTTSPNLVLIRVEVSWTDDGAVPGSDEGRYDHAVSLELIRTRVEAL